jgi:hypothetical protein
VSKRKKQVKRQQPLSPKKYIVTRARSLPVYKCMVNSNWKASGMASIIVMRKHSNGHITAGFFLTDLLAKGVKDTHFVFNEPEREIYDRLPESQEIGEIKYELAHNIIYGGVAFAEEHGMQPHKDFDITQYILAEDTDAIELIDIDFGVDGKPVFFSNGEGDNDGEQESHDDFYSFSDDDWREFLNSPIKIEDDEVAVVSDALFRRWLDKHHPVGPGSSPPESMKDTRISFQPMEHKDEQERKDMEEVYIAMGEPDLPKWKITSIENKIRQIMTRTPENPIWHNYLGVCAQLREDDVQYKIICESIIRRFPDYVLGKIMWVNLLIDENRIGEVRSFLNDVYTLPEVCPERNTFHITELVSFHGTMIRYFIRTGNLRQAQLYSDIVFEFQGQAIPNSNIFEMSQSEFMEVKTKKVMEYLEEFGLPSSSFKQ